MKKTQTPQDNDPNIDNPNDFKLGETLNVKKTKIIEKFFNIPPFEEFLPPQKHENK